MAATKTYTFKSMKSWAAWARGLALFYVLGLAAYGATIAWTMSGATSDTAEAVVGFAAILYLTGMISSGVIALCWIYGAARNARALRPNMELSPGWAVGWFFVPFANLYKPMTVMRDIWQASAPQIDGIRPPPPRLIATWWWVNLAGNIALNLGGRLSQNDRFTLSLPDLLTLGGIVLVLVATLLFRNLVKIINDLQKNADTQIADTF